MPLLYKKPFDPPNELPNELQDTEEVFYCELTNEIFKDYEAFCERIILCNSLVWSCQYTGKSNFTFQEALNCEEAAKKTLKEFPMRLRIPVLYLTSLIERKSLHELAEDVFCFARDRYFVGEIVEVAISDDIWCSCHVIKVFEPTQKQLEEYRTVQTKNGERQFWPPASLYRYCVELIHEQTEEDLIMEAQQIHRKKGIFTREKNRLYIKQFVELKNGIWRLKESTSTKSGIPLVKFNEIFAGEPPIFNPGKKPLINGLTKKSDDSLKKVKRQESLHKYFSKKSPSKESTQTSKNISSKKPETPQKLMAKKLKEKYKTVNNMKHSKLMNKIKDKQHILKEKKKYMKKELLQANQTNLSSEELLKIKERKKEEKLKLQAEKRAKKMELANFMKEWNRQREDLELEDLKELPTPIPLELRIPTECFGDFVMVMEFLHTFGQSLQIKGYFPGGLTFDVLERALVDKEVAGPLCDIVQMFLDAIFKLQEEEEDEIRDTDLEKGQDLTDDRRDLSSSEAVKYATSAAMWSQLYQGTPLSKLTIDASTITEVLRLHLLASGGRCGENSAKWRYQQRGGYTSSDDPGLMLRMQQPHILSALSRSTICDIPIGDKLAVLSCLMNQILTFSDLRDQIDERSEKVRQGKMELRRYALDSKKEKELFLKSKTGEMTPEQLNHEKTQLEKQKLNHKRKLEELNELNTFTQVMPLGLDRAYRRFWMFSSLPGIFIEYNNEFSGTCLPKPTPLDQGMMRLEDPISYVRKLFEEGSNKENLAGDKLIKTPGTPNKKLLSEKNGDCEDTKRNKISEIYRPLTCWADPINCPVHGVNKVSWAFFKEESDLNRLIESLNDRGIREHNLRKILLEEKDKILQSIAKCPASKLSSSIVPQVEEPRKTLRNNNSRYDNANLNFPPGTPSDEILESVLRDLILETEKKINDGCLGSLKVDDREAWKNTIMANSYDKQCDRLIWGPKKRHPVDSFDNIPEDDTKSEESESRPDTPSSDLSYKDSLRFIGNDIIQSSVIKDLASAILQVEQSIDPKYLKRPLGLDYKERNKDKDNLKKEDYLRVKERWETSLMSSTSFPQLFLHFTTLDNSIAWGKSILKAFCRICRRRGDPEKMLLCDTCNKGHHMYCLKPQLKKVPEGDWFCVRCKPREKVTPVKKFKPSFTADSEVEEITDTREDKKIGVKELPVGKCKTCLKKGNLVTCDSCGKGQHFECIYPPIRKIPARKWFCHKCRQPNPSTPQDETSPTEAERSSRRRCSKAATAKISQFAKQLRSNSWDGNADEKDKTETGIPLNSRRRSRRSLETDVGLSPSVAKDLPLDNATLQELLEALMHHKDAWPFLRPVTRADVPDYHNIIKRPMDFGTIKHKLNMLEYRNNSEVIADALLVFENCFSYNQSDTDIFQCGVRLQRNFEKLCRDRSLTLNQDEVRIPETKRSRTVF